MLWTKIPNKTVRNRILCNLHHDDFEALRPYLSLVELRRGTTLQKANARLEHVYFIESGCLSRVVRTQDDGLIQVSIAGKSGFIGVGVALGTMTSLHHAVVLIPGQALRIDIKDMQRLVQERPTIHQQLLLYVQSLIIHESQTAHCNTRHELDQRLARWILLAHQQFEESKLPVTQDLLATMLSVRPASVSATLARLDAQGLIRRSRGSIEVINHTALKHYACECFCVIKQTHDRLFPATTSEHVIVCEKLEDRA